MRRGTRSIGADCLSGAGSRDTFQSNLVRVSHSSEHSQGTMLEHLSLARYMFEFAVGVRGRPMLMRNFLRMLH